MRERGGVSHVFANRTCQLRMCSFTCSFLESSKARGGGEKGREKKRGKRRMKRTEEGKGGVEWQVEREKQRVNKSPNQCPSAGSEPPVSRTVDHHTDHPVLDRYPRTTSLRCHKGYVGRRRQDDRPNQTPALPPFAFFPSCLEPANGRRWRDSSPNKLVYRKRLRRIGSCDLHYPALFTLPRVNRLWKPFNNSRASWHAQLG